MISRINKLKDFGIYKDYNRNGIINDFDQLNIIYGWNYSGKTTISRLFSFINSELNTEYKGSQFELQTTKGDIITETNLSLSDRKIRVFNADFIEKNIRWDGDTFEAIKILLVGEDSIKAQEEINALNYKSEKLKALIRKLNSEKESINGDISSNQTAKANEIKRTLQLVSTYTKVHLKPVFDSIKDTSNDYILPDNLYKTILEKALKTEKDRLPDNLQTINLNLNISSLVDEVNNLIFHVPELTQTIEYFVRNPSVATWVEEGLPIHSNKDECEYCGSTISEERRTELMAHFSEDLRNHKRKLVSLKSKIAENKVSKVTLTSYNFYSDYKEKFNKECKISNKEIDNYNSELDSLVELVNRKIDAPFKADFKAQIVHFTDKTLIESINEINTLVNSNNQASIDLIDDKNKSIESIKKHMISELIETLQLDKKESKLNLYTTRISHFNTQFKLWGNKIDTLEAQISQAQKGKEELNKYISTFLGRNEIKVDVTKEGTIERFVLKRGNEKANNLSEGEKMAIAFSFFLTSLLEIENLDTTIVYIDDPISSLDSNHIFQVNAVIKSFFCIRENENSPWKLNVKQLFISTHNFDFFNLLRELPNKNKRYFQTVRTNQSKSTFKNLSKSLLNYSSEYHYLFEILYNFSNSDNKDDYPTLIGIPNAVRRFTELYTYSRLPTNKSATVDQRADILWGSEKSKRILKVLHYFSHANSIEKLIGNSDLICDIENAVDDLLVEIKADEKHYNELIKALPK